MNMAIERKGFHGAKLALFVGDKLAVILRDDKPNIPSPNHWDMPGGGREGCETPLECVLRETYEELNIHVDPDAVVWGKRFPYPDGDRWFFLWLMSMRPSQIRLDLGMKARHGALNHPKNTQVYPIILSDFQID